MQIAVCLLPERELAAELVVFSQMHAARLGGDTLSLTSNRPRLTLCSGEVDEWGLSPDFVAELAPAEPLSLRFGMVMVDNGTVIGPLGAPGKVAARALVGLQARATVRLGLRLPDRWVPGIVLGRSSSDRLHPALKADWSATMEGREVTMSRLGFLRIDDDGRATGTIASHGLA